MMLVWYEYRKSGMPMYPLAKYYASLNSLMEALYRSAEDTDGGV